MISLSPAHGWIMDDHMMNTSGSENWQVVSNGTGAQLSGNGVVGTRQNMGITTFQTGTTSTGRTKITSGPVMFGGGTWLFQATLAMQQLSTATDEYRAYIGFYDGTTTDGTNTCMFLYDRSTYGDVWVTDTTTSGVRTTNASSTSIVAANFVRLTIEINAAASRIKFSVNGSIIATHTTNIPTGNQTTMSVAVRKTAGTTSLNTVALDHILIQYNRSTPLWTN